MIKFSCVKKEDILGLAKVYIKAFNKEGDHRTMSKSKKMIEYRYKKSVKIKVVSGSKIVGAFFSDIKPLYFGNVLNDGDVFIDPIYQKKGLGKQLFIYGIEYAQKEFNVVGWDFYTFKNSYQYKRYKRMGFSDSNKRILMSGKIDKVLKKLTSKG